MDKQEAIKKAYNEIGLPFHENILFDNGWLKIKPTQYQSKYSDVDLLKLNNHVHSIRPKSLSGIENNNGWTKIESEEDLPKKGVSCHFILKSGVTGIFIDLDDSEYLTLKNRATHYKLIQTPKPPIY